MILLDTDICIELLRGNKKVINKINDYSDNISISFMTLGELYYGVYKSSNPLNNSLILETFLLSVNILHTDNNIMQKFGEYKNKLSEKGEGLTDADILIASTASVYGCKLITGNVKHFKRFEGVNVENWIG